MFRDIKTLRGLGFSIEPNSETRNYEAHNALILPEVQFEMEEVLALTTLGLTDGGHEHTPFVKAARRAVMKLLNSLPHAMQDNIRDVDRVLTIVPEPIHPIKEFSDFFDSLFEAYRSKRAVRIRYKSPVEQEFETVLEPYRLFFCRHCWYVIGRSSLHRERRTFSLGRIKKLEKTNISYEIPAGFSLKQYLGNAWQMIREPGLDQKVTVQFSPLVAQNVAEVSWHPTQHIVWNEDNTMDYTVTVSGLNEISWWILGYGREAKVLRPPKLRKIIQQHAQEMLKQYSE